MTVLRVYSNNVVQCRWFSGNDMRVDMLPLATLKEMVTSSPLLAAPYGAASGARRYGARKDAADVRDLRLSLSALSPLPTPPSHDESRWLGPVRDQGAESSCVGHAWAAHASWLFNKFGDKGSLDFSPQFLYYLARQLEGTLPADGGCQVRSGAKALNQYGAALETDDPYEASTLNQAPTIAAVKDALNFKGGAYHRLTSVLDMKACLASGYAFVDGIEVYASFESAAVARSGEVPLPNAAAGEFYLGGHCVLTFGYDDNHVNLDSTRGAFHKRNSWGAAWGEGGDFWLPYAYMQKYLMDAWVLHLGPAWVKKP